ncbi:hypothetical protein Tco_1155386 [Tanacetum coccineum]
MCSDKEHDSAVKQQVSNSVSEDKVYDEKEFLRRNRISKANKGWEAWNKGVKHSPGAALIDYLRASVVARLLICKMIAKQFDNQLRWNVPKSNAIARQNSMYNLTLDEVKNQLGDLGKPLSNMNLDELLKSVWTTEGDLNAQPIVGHKKSKMLSKLQAALEDIEATRASGRLALRAMSAFHENNQFEASAVARLLICKMTAKQLDNQLRSNGPKSDAIARQNSMYNLTLDEVQNQLGDLGHPLSSMNLDELLKSVWTTEGDLNAQPIVGLSLGRQSSIGLSQDLRKRTVDELWQDIQQGHKKIKMLSKLQPALKDIEATRA